MKALSSAARNFELGPLVRSLRESRGLSARALSSLVGASPSYVNKLENGLIPRLDTFARLTEALGCSDIEVLFLLHTAHSANSTD